MKSNFEYLKRYWPALAQIGAAAENYLNACIYKACRKELIILFALRF